MKLHKKAVAILTVMVMAVSATPVGATNKAEGHWANKIVNQYVAANYLVGDQKNIKNINQDITRDEFIDLINHVFGYKVTNQIVKDIPTSRAYMTREEAAIVLTRVLGLEVEKDSSALVVFKDSKDISEWALPYVRTIVGKGYYGGYEDKTLRMTKKYHKSRNSGISSQNSWRGSESRKSRK
ncbi:MAG: S-layer homology domain-containing protein [Cellulosilyticaceae bacterium]